MKPFFLCLLLLGGFCSTAQKNKLKIDSLLVFRPVTEIWVIKEANKQVIDTPLSTKAHLLATKYALELIPDTVVTQLYKDDSRQAEVNNIIADIVLKSSKKLFSRKSGVPEQLVQILDSMNRDFALGIVNVGFVRTKENMVNEYSNTRAVNFLSLGYIDVVPNESFSTIFCFIIHRKQKKMYFFEKSMDAKNPTDPIVIKSQLRNLLMGYFMR